MLPWLVAIIVVAVVGKAEVVFTVDVAAALAVAVVAVAGFAESVAAVAVA